MKYFPLIWSGIWRKRGRAVLILLQIMVAFLLFGLLQGMKTAMDVTVDNMEADVYFTQSAENTGPLPLAYRERILAVPGVKRVNVQNFFGAAYQKPSQQVFIMATDFNGDSAQDYSRFIKKEDIEKLARARTGTLVSLDLARKYGWKIGDRIPLQSQLKQQNGSGDWSFEIVGTFEDHDHGMETAILINNSYLDEARAGPKGLAQRFTLSVKDVNQGAEIARAVDKLFANSSDETRTESMREMTQSQLQSIGDMNLIVRAVVIAVMFALLFSTGAMMMQSVRERTSELAVLKALGFSDRRVFFMVLLESLILCVASAALGLLLASRVLPLAKQFLARNVPMPSSVLIAGFLIAVIMALLSAALPAWRASRLQVSEALAGR